MVFAILRFLLVFGWSVGLKSTSHGTKCIPWLGFPLCWSSVGLGELPFRALGCLFRFLLVLDGLQAHPNRGAAAVDCFQAGLDAFLALDHSNEISLHPNCVQESVICRSTQADL